MTRTLIFELSDVLVPGLTGIEVPLAARLGVPPDTVLPAFRGFLFDALCCGLIAETTYLRLVCEQKGWKIDTSEIKAILRQNFVRSIRGMEAVVAELGRQYELVVFADHSAEWVADIRMFHPWLRTFSKQFYSYELKLTKRDPRAFRQVVRELGRPPAACLVVDGSAANIRAAAAAGLTGRLFFGAEQLARELALLTV